MAETETDHTKFNVGALLTFPNNDKENKKLLCFGAYNGNVQLSIRNAEYQPGTKPRSVTITPHMGYMIHEILDDLVKTPQPGKKHTLIFNGRWNKEARKRELSFLFTVGMSDSAVCYIGIKHIDYQGDQFSGRFDLVGDRNLEIAGFYEDEKSRSFQTLKMLRKYFDDMFLQAASLLTRNHLVNNFGGNNRRSASASPSESSISSAGADDEF